jgi:hypothetical protein
MAGKAGLRIAYSNQKLSLYVFDQSTQTKKKKSFGDQFQDCCRL